MTKVLKLHMMVSRKMQGTERVLFRRCQRESAGGWERSSQKEKESASGSRSAEAVCSGEADTLARVKCFEGKTVVFKKSGTADKFVSWEEFVRGLFYDTRGKRSLNHMSSLISG